MILLAGLGQLPVEGVTVRNLGGATILEPMMTVEVIAGEDATGDVIADLSQRRGRPQSKPTEGRSTMPDRRQAILLTAALLLVGLPAAAQEVLIEKRTNGQDADTPPGPALLVGDPVTWTYEVTNATGRDLVSIVVTDDQGVTVTCPAAALGPGESMTCTGNGTVVAGQYANVGTVTAEQPDGTPVEASDPSHYFGQAQPALTLEKSTEGIDADTPPGPVLAVGDPVDWTYEVTNVGSEAVSDIAVTDDQGVVVSCPGTDLSPGASMTCTASGTVEPGQYANVGAVEGLLPDETPVAASDPSHYFGQSLLLEKRTNGFDADTPPGPVVEAGSTVTWTYEVTNPGPETVTGLVVTDDQGVTVSCLQTTLAAGESVVCTASDTAEGGQYANVGTAKAQLPAPGGTVSASDPSHYFGTLIRIEKSTNGEDADSPPGPVLAVGDPVAWEYLVTNFSDETMTDVAVEDDQGVIVTCPGTTLFAEDSMTCTAAGTAQAGQYANVGTVTATHPSGPVTDSDPSHYFGQDQVLDFGDAPDPTFPTLFANNGARHVLGSDVYLGSCVDAELDGQPNATATGDDAATGSVTFGTCAVPGDDEDGVTFTSPLVAGQTADVEVVASAPCTLSAWIDFTGDGDWNDPGETLFPGGVALAAGVNALSFPVPAGAVGGAQAARFRCTTAGPTSPGDTLLYTVVVENVGDAPAEGVVFTDTPDPNSDLVVGSVTTSAGTVVTGNTAGDASVEVDIGTLAAGGSATITFEVVIDPALLSSVTEIVNQGLVAADGLDDVLTDDPAEPGPEDPTVIAVVVAATSVLEIPTLSAWGALLLALLLAALAWPRVVGGP
ncbi:MAG TPA: GEVED domain-containing protein [Thermoanaerobaculia bacterium]|nr:GEVED domain-containing protein [Thermoanaerobaculia bacterium]